MATVRIYKVAELLGTTSQEVSALLKRDHGIEVKSASSTIEEVVGRQFVERLARQRSISLPGGDIFAETPVVKGKKGAPAKKPAEPVKPAAPALPPPRLVKMAKPAPAPAAPVAELGEEVAALPAEADEEAAAEIETPEPESIATHPVAAVAVIPGDTPAGIAVETLPAPSAEAAAAPVATAPRAEPSPKPTPGRVVPPTLRLRIEEQRPTAPTPPLQMTPAPRPAPRPPAPAASRPPVGDRKSVV